MRDYAQVKGNGEITKGAADAAFENAGRGCGRFSISWIENYLKRCLFKFGYGPVGLDNVAAAIGEERDTIEDVLEPHLIQQGYLQRTPRAASPPPAPTNISDSPHHAVIPLGICGEFDSLFRPMRRSSTTHHAKLTFPSPACGRRGWLSSNDHQKPTPI